MRRFWKWTKRTVLILLCLLVIAIGGGWLWLRTSLPDLDGTVVVQGVKAPVQIVRDKNAIPHIYASHQEDAYFALGYAHAQDRLFQMEMSRRIGAGRLAEVVGGAALSFDKFTRTLGLYRLAGQSYKGLSEPARRALDAYSAGVNAYLQKRSGALPPEFYLLRFRPEAWKPADSLVWARLMAIRLASNWRSELLRARIVKQLGADKISVLWPPYPGDGPVTIPSQQQGLYRGLALERILAALPLDYLRKGNSNQWVVHGRLTKSGKPILANDPHLGLSAPTMWYLARIEAPGLSVTGATVPGVPLTILGHNGRVAWGVTNTYIDTDDLFVEKLDPKDSSKYVTPDGPKPFVTRQEVIRVRGADPVTITVRETRHGPVVSDILRDEEKIAIPSGHVLALSAPWLRPNDTTAEAFYEINRARDALGVVAALRKYQSPPQNFVFADVGGNIGFYAAGLVPMRKKGDGFLPSPGWTGEYDWTGFIPFDELPRGLNPASGMFVNANNKSVDKDYPHFLSREWGDFYRAGRIKELLQGQDRKTVAGSMDVQKDTVSMMAADILPLLLRAPESSERAKQAVKMLSAWDHKLDRNRPEGLIFFAWFAELNRRLYTDELKDLAKRYVGVRADVVKSILTRYTDWCNDTATAARETCDQQIAASLEAALSALTDRYGSDMTAWRWGDAHFADMRNRVFDFIPILRNFANLRIPTDGGPQTINKAAFRSRDKNDPFSARHGPGFRAVYDLSDLGDSRFMISTGESGNLFSSYYDNFLTRWRDVEYITIEQNRVTVGSAATGILTLRPPNPPK